MIALRNITLISALAFSSTPYAATEFPGNLVPAEIAEEFVFGNIYSSLPENFPAPTLPAGTQLYVLGSVDNGTSQRILLGTTHTGQELREILKTGYSASGWIDLSRSPTSLDLCHDVHGRLSFQMGDPVGTEKRVLVNRYRTVALSGEALTCAQQLAYQNGGPPSSLYALFLESVPVLQVPPQTAGSGPALPFGRISSSSGSSGAYYERQQDTSLTIPDFTLAKLQQHFALQLTQVGWALDGAAVGEKSASAVWFRTVHLPVTTTSQTAATDMLLTGVLTLLYVKNDTYRVTFTVHTGEIMPSTAIGISGFSRD